MVYQGFFEILMITLISRKKLGGYKIMRYTVEKILKGSLDSTPLPSPSVLIQIMGGKVCSRCKGKTLLGDVNKLCLITSSKLSRQYLNFQWKWRRWVGLAMGSNPGYHLKSFLPYINFIYCGKATKFEILTLHT